jgi:hypothetical protein
VATQATGIPELDVVVEPGAPQGIPTAGRGSRPDGVVVGDGECALVVSATVVCATEGEVAVVAGDTVAVGGALGRGVGGLTIGGGMAIAGAGSSGGVVVTGGEVSTVAGVSSG